MRGPTESPWKISTWHLGVAVCLRRADRPEEEQKGSVVECLPGPMQMFWAKVGLF